MKPFALLLLMVSMSQAYADTDRQRSVYETFDAFVGEWDMELVADGATFGDRGGPGTGTMRCAWGTMQAWVDCELEADYEGIGRYALMIVLYRAGPGEALGAFVTNSFGGGRQYVGRWESADALVYRDAWVDPDRKWEHQRTTYTFHDNGEIRYEIDVSANGTDYSPHSSGIYRRKQGPAASGPTGVTPGHDDG